jgi:hypothetical protein
MAIIDRRLTIANAASVAAAAGTALIGDQIDLGAQARDIGSGEPLYLTITVDTSIITAGAAGTIQFFLVSDASAAIATNGTASVHWASKVFVTDDDALNDLDAGEVVCSIPLPSEGQVPYERFLGVLATVGTTAVTAGAISAVITKDPAVTYKYYNDASN